MEALIKEHLDASVVKRSGETGGGCINQGETYITDKGKVYVKWNSKPMAKLMFDGEFESLQALQATEKLQVPKPLKVVEIPSGGAFLIMEHLRMHSINKYSALLGEQLARLHLHNEELHLKYDSQMVNGASRSSTLPYVSKFGFHCTTCCGYLPQNNSWHDDWPSFFAQQKLQPQIVTIQEKFGNNEIGPLWSRLETKIPHFFKGIDVKPSLLHGDLWSGNVAENDRGPVIFDPASFYGHSEFELSISKLFGGFSKDFFLAYHKLIPKAAGFDDRILLYKLFHYLNHWNHFGDGYRASSVSTMKKLVAIHK